MTTFSEILEGYNLISPYSQYKEKVMVHCPFHSDNTPSLSINFIYNNYRCFSCNEEGSAFDLVYALERKQDTDLTAMQASIRVRNILNGIEDVTPLEREEYANRQKAYKEKLHSYDEVDNVYRFYKSLERIDWEIDWDEARDVYWKYLNGRGLTCTTLNDFHIRINSTSTNPIVIPVLEQGIFKGYVARRIDGVKQRKYKNNNGLDKENTVVGNLVEDDLVIVCEGMLDLMMSYQNGFKNTCCLLGCMPSPAQLLKLAQKTDTILWATDNDTAGDNGYRVAKGYFDSVGVTVRRFKFGYDLKDLGEITSSHAMMSLVKNSLKGL